jgi:hypothetical protein
MKVEKCYMKVNHIVDLLRQSIHPNDERTQDLIEDLEIALSDLETIAISLEERVEELEELKHERIA